MKTKFIQSAACIGALVLIIISGARPSAHAQEKKEIKKTIIIKNGDTIINGKSLKDVSKAERKKLLKEMEEMKGSQRIEIDKEAKADGNMRVIIRKQKDGQPEEVIVKDLRGPRAMVFKDGEVRAFAPDGLPQHFKFESDTLMFKMEGDSAFKQMHIRMKDLDSNLRKHFSFKNGEGEDVEFYMHPQAPGAPAPPLAPRMRIMERNEVLDHPKNSQSFAYSSVDKDGISTRLHIRVSDASKEALTKITGSESAKIGLDVQDLNIFPSFSTGKLNLAFSLKSKGALEVKVLDSSYQAVFSEKLTAFNESYYKSLILPKNGVYFLAINQSGSWFIRKVVKE